jgi:hypothetical protein
VARGLFPIGALDAVAAHLDDIFLTHGFKLSAATGARTIRTGA